MAWWILLAAVAVSVAVSFLLRPRTKKPKPDAVDQGENPVADAGRPIPVVFGTVMMKEPNCLHYGDKTLRTYKTKA